MTKWWGDKSPLFLYMINRKKIQDLIDEFIVDFYCKDLLLAIEVDGSSHDSDGAQIKDKKRQKRLESLGVSFLRFDDLEVKKDMLNVLREIEFWIKKKTHP